MGPAEALAILGVGLAAGTVNAIVGSGSLITFPTLLAFGFPPVVANVSNNVGLVPGNVSGAFGYRRELAGQRTRLVRLGVVSAVGSMCGAAALLSLPSSSFQFIVPVLILLACALVLVQPWLGGLIIARRTRRLAASARSAAHGDGEGDGNGSGEGDGNGTGEGDGNGSGEGDGNGTGEGGGEPVSPVLGAGILASAAYGGYFGAAQGVLVIGLLGTFLDESMQRVNGAKNVLVGVVNGVAALVYIVFAHVAWLVVLLIATGSTIGGLVGARFGRRLPPTALRIFVVLIGVIAAVKLLVF